MPRLTSRLVPCVILVSLAACAARTAPLPTAPPTRGAVLGEIDPPASQSLADLWDAVRRPLPAAPLVTHEIVSAELRRLVAEAPDRFALEEFGRSVEGRPLWHASVGRGPMRVLLWSQMHGDEPSATPALIDLLETIRRYPESPRVARLTEKLTLDVVPMLNPDGAVRYQRRNAQAIDINRDALRLQTPEGLALKALRDRLSPALGFNLHNQNWRTSVGRPPKPATISLLAVAFDEARTESPGRILAKRVSAVVRDAVEPLAPGQIGRYDDEFEERAFGDNVTRWGTPVVLIESGAWSGEHPDESLTRINYVALVSALDAIASGRVDAAPVSRYESLPENEDRLFHTLIVNATVVPGTGVAPFLADVGVVAQRVVRVLDGERRLGLAARVDDIGDLRVYGALKVIDATGLVLAPLTEPAPKPGDTVRVDDRAVLSSRIGIGAPAAFLLLRPGRASGTYTVERVVAIGDPTQTPPQ